MKQKQIDSPPSRRGHPKNPQECWVNNLVSGHTRHHSLSSFSTRALPQILEQEPEQHAKEITQKTQENISPSNRRRSLSTSVYMAPPFLTHQFAESPKKILRHTRYT